jgi:hypothetical protein
MTAGKTTLGPVIMALALSPLPRCNGQGAQQRPKADRNQVVELLMRSQNSAKEVEDREEHDVLMGDIAQDLGKLGETVAARKTFALIIDDKWRDYTLRPFLDGELRARDFAGAQRTVDAITTAQGRAEAFCALASALWESDRRLLAKKSLGEAETIFAENRKELTNAVFLDQLAKTQDELGEVAKASETKRELNKLSGGYGYAVDKFDTSWLTSASGKLRETGRGEMESGNLTAARSSLQRAANEIDSVPHVGDRAILLYMIGSDQASAGDNNGARDTFLRADQKAESLPEADRDLILRDVVREQASAGFIEDSLRAAATIKDNHLKWQALHGIAVSQTEQIDLETGLKTAAQIQSESEYDVTLVDIARFLGKQNEPRQIYRVVELIHSPYMKSLALKDAAEAMAGIQEPEDGL